MGNRKHTESDDGTTERRSDEDQKIQLQLPKTKLTKRGDETNWPKQIPNTDA